jgi:mannose-6-phosphate isomerase-like protein (cupin superfamily)
MAITFNESTVAPQTAGTGVQCQPLLTDAQVPGIRLRLERLTLGAGAALEISVPAADLAWFQILSGEAALTHAGSEQPLSDAHVAFLPAGFCGKLASRAGAALLLARVPQAAQLDTGFSTQPPALRIIDWTCEPVLQSEHDARKRIYLVTPKLFSTKAIKGEMIIYPPGTEAANHHHEGAAHFMYILSGSGTCYANEKPFPVRKGDVVYYADSERHYLRSDASEEMRFSEFFVPGVYKTVWAKDAKVCTWLPAGANIRGEKASREIAAHSSALPTPQDV